MNRIEVHCGYEPVAGPCAFCGRDDTCAMIGHWYYEGVFKKGPEKPACESCWHAERGKSQAFQVFRIDTPEHVRQYGRLACGSPGTLEEAGAFLVEMMRRDPSNRYTVDVSEWDASRRRAHPGYMARRRLEIDVDWNEP